MAAFAASPETQRPMAERGEVRGRRKVEELTLLAEATHRLAGRDDPQCRKRVLNHTERLGRDAQQALKEMRSLVYALRPLTLDQQGLAAALRQRLETVEARAGVVSLCLENRS